MPTPKKLRLDELLLQRGLAESRSQAQGLILGGKVRSPSAILDKPGKSVPADLELTVEAPPRYVSRGGLKLEGFLDAFPFPLHGAHVLDLGASTGGFTDCLLQRGAADAVCVDVGRGQLHYKLQQDPRVTSLEKTNARSLDPAVLPRQLFDIVTLDLSFISLKPVLPHAWTFVPPGGHLIALIKPQFEAGKAEADAGKGVIRDPAIHQRVITEIRALVRDRLPGAREFGFAPSQIKGPDGNQEFLIGWQRTEETPEL